MYLTATLSHEIRNPLTSVLAALRLLSTTALDDNQRKLLSTADSANCTLLSLLDEILQRTRAGGTYGICKQEFSIAELIYPLLTLYSCQAQQKGVILMAHTHPAVPKNLYHDVGKIRQILSNLLANAVRFTDNGIIKLQITPTSTHENTPVLCFRVIDSGAGIPPAALSKIFEAYQQARNSQQHADGTGLGLSISQALAHAMGGNIAVSSAEGRGSVFTLTLPILNEREIPYRSTSPIPQQRIS